MALRQPGLSWSVQGFAHNNCSSRLHISLFKTLKHEPNHIAREGNIKFLDTIFEHLNGNDLCRRAFTRNMWYYYAIADFYFSANHPSGDRNN